MELHPAYIYFPRVRHHAGEHIREGGFFLYQGKFLATGDDSEGLKAVYEHQGRVQCCEMDSYGVIAIVKKELAVSFQVRTEVLELLSEH